jgi:hypothetical protein
LVPGGDGGCLLRGSQWDLAMDQLHLASPSHQGRRGQAVTIKSSFLSISWHGMMQCLSVILCSFAALHRTSGTLHGSGLRSTPFLFFPFAQHNKQKLLSGSLDFPDAHSLPSLSHFATLELQLFYGWHID